MNRCGNCGVLLTLTNELTLCTKCMNELPNSYSSADTHFVRNTADDMLAALGFTRYDEAGILIEYIRHGEVKGDRFILTFALVHKYYTYYVENRIKKSFPSLITAELHKAVNKKIEELGW